jgi:hypothetical protein
MGLEARQAWEHCKLLLRRVCSDWLTEGSCALQLAGCPLSVHNTHSAALFLQLQAVEARPVGLDVAGRAPVTAVLCDAYGLKTCFPVRTTHIENLNCSKVGHSLIWLRSLLPI